MTFQKIYMERIKNALLHSSKIQYIFSSSCVCSLVPYSQSYKCYTSCTCEGRRQEIALALDIIHKRYCSSNLHNNVNKLDHAHLFRTYRDLVTRRPDKVVCGVEIDRFFLAVEFLTWQAIRIELYPVLNQRLYRCIITPALWRGSL